jgi:hypothetical protein
MEVITKIFEEHNAALARTIPEDDNHNFSYGCISFSYTLTHARCVIISYEHSLHIIMILMSMFESRHVQKCQ